MEVAASGGDGPVRRDVSPKVMQLVRPCPEPRPLLLPSGKIREKFSSSRREKNKRQKKKKKKGKANTSAFVWGDNGRSPLRWNLFCAR